MLAVFSLPEKLTVCWRAVIVGYLLASQRSVHDKGDIKKREIRTKHDRACFCVSVTTVSFSI